MSEEDQVPRRAQPVRPGDLRASHRRRQERVEALFSALRSQSRRQLHGSDHPSQPEMRAGGRRPGRGAARDSRLRGGPLSSCQIVEHSLGASDSANVGVVADPAPNEPHENRDAYTDCSTADESEQAGPGCGSGRSTRRISTMLSDRTSSDALRVVNDRCSEASRPTSELRSRISDTTLSVSLRMSSIFAPSSMSVASRISMRCEATSASSWRSN